MRFGLFGVLMIAAVASTAHSGRGGSSCSGDWRVTGYFTVKESDFARPRVKVTADDGRTGWFRGDFLNRVRIEGWGRGDGGDYVGFDEGEWQLSSRPLTALGDTLKIGSVAVDPEVISANRVLIIPTLTLFSDVRFETNDVGRAVKGKHVDVYTGEGKRGEQIAKAITGRGHTVCVVPS